jgi:hypothetical protein
VGRARRRVLERHSVAGADALHEPEVDDLGDVRPPAALGEQDVRRLDVAVDEPDAVRLAERLADLAQDVDDAAGMHRTVAADELLEVDSVQELHRVVEEPVRRAPVVVDRDRVRRRQLRGHLDLPLEPREVHLAGALRRQDLDRGRTAQQRVPRAIDRPHAALADLLDERVGPSRRAARTVWRRP